MSVFITYSEGLLTIPTPDDVEPERFCCGECGVCRPANRGGCPAQARVFEIIADRWLLAAASQ